MLRVADLTVSYGGTPALSGVSLAVQAGEILAVVGSNGAGKSSLLRCISGLERASSGSVSFEDQALAGQTPRQIVERGVVLVPEGRHLFPEMTVLENLKLGALARRARHALAEGLERAFALFPVLKERRRQAVGSLSGGEQQMVAIARGLMLQPRLLMLDEPSLGLAPKMVASILDTLRVVNAQGVTVMLVEQNVRRALQLAHRALVLENGRIVLQGPARDLLDKPEVKQAYLGM